MSKTIKVDEFEPIALEAVISKAQPDTIRTALNRLGYADYRFGVWDNTTENWERKTVNEILGDPDSVEEQLRRQKQRCEHLGLIVEDIAEARPDGTQTYQLTANGKYFRPVKKWGTPYVKYLAFLTGIDAVGIQVWFTSSWVGTAYFILRRYKMAQDPTRTTLNRYTTPHPELFDPDPQVRALLGLCEGYKEKYSLSIGPETAQKLIAVFRTVGNLLDQHPDDIIATVEGIGRTRVEGLLRAVGKLE